MRQILNPLGKRAMLASMTLLALAGCSEGVSVDTTDNAVQPSSDATGQPLPLNVNDPLNTLSEPQTRNFIGAVSSTTGECGLLSQSAGDAFATPAFVRGIDTDGNPFLQATRPESSDTPEFIEFCVSTEELARYRILAQTRAPSILEDSFFVTVDEDEAGRDSSPGIYDVPASVDNFIEGEVRTRTQRPLEFVLEAGEHIVRFYYREPNTAIKSIRLEAQTDEQPVPEPGESGIAQCAINTGLSEEAIEALLEEYLGNAPRRYVLTPFEINEGFTERNDWRWNINGESGTVMCLSDPGAGRTNLVDNTITRDRIVIGSSGVDLQFEPTTLEGTFIGNGGADSVDIVGAGTFVGGVGADNVGVVQSGRVIAGAGDDVIGTLIDGGISGGAGNDTVDVLRGGRFDGEEGDDRVVDQFGGLFDGGPGVDTVEDQAQAGESVNVENIGGGFEPLSAPTDLALLEASDRRVLVQWTASPDERTDGYEVTVGEPASGEFGPELGIEPTGFTTPRTIAMFSGFRTDDALTVRAYADQGDGSFLYSAPLVVSFSLPSVDELLAEQTVLASLIRDDTSRGAGRTAEGTIVVGTSPTFPPSSQTSVFTRYDASLQSPEDVSDEFILGTSYDISYGSTRQYVLQNGDDGTLIIAFDGDVRNQLFQQPLELIGSPFNNARCDADHVTQDDWLVCIGLNGGLHGFSPDGDSFPLDIDLDYFSPLVDGAQGRIVQLDDDLREPLQSMSVVDLEADTLTELPLDFSGQIDAGERVGAHGLAVQGNSVLIAGGVFDDTCRADPNCFRATNEALGYFLASVDIDTGAIQQFQPYALQERPGDGVGQFIGDTVVFGDTAPLTRHDAATLVGIERVFLPGQVQDANDNSTLTLVPTREGIEQQDDFYLLAP